MCDERKRSSACLTPGRSSKPLSFVYLPSIIAGFILFSSTVEVESSRDVGGVDSDGAEDLLETDDEMVVGDSRSLSARAREKNMAEGERGGQRVRTVPSKVDVKRENL